MREKEQWKMERGLIKPEGHVLRSFSDFLMSSFCFLDPRLLSLCRVPSPFCISSTSVLSFSLFQLPSTLLFLSVSAAVCIPKAICPTALNAAGLEQVLLVLAGMVTSPAYVHIDATKPGLNLQYGSFSN